MKTFLSLTILLCTISFGEAPKKLSQFLKVDEFVKGEIGVIQPPEEINEYINKVEKAAYKDPEWFSSYSQQSESGVPLPYHEKLGLTKDEYDQYISLWNERKFVPVEQVSLRLEKASDGKWMIRSSGSGFPISALRYDETKNELRSPNGAMVPIDNINTSAQSILGEWKGYEWKNEAQTTISKTKENFAIGMKADKKHGYLIYRLQEVSYTGKLLYDKNVVIRFPNIL